MRRIFFLYCFLSFFSLYPLCNYAHSDYKEVHTSQGKVIVGLDSERALGRFGLPASVTEDLWYYAGPEKFFIYFPSASLLSIHSYPPFSEGKVGIPLEFKALGHFSNFKIEDITSRVQLLLSEPQNFVLEKPGVIIPKKEGSYQILMKYKDIFSNPSYIMIRKPLKIDPEKEKLLSINVLPYKPIVPHESRLKFIALGTFIDHSKYFTRDISEEAEWFIQQGESVISIKDNQISFSSLGKFKVFCKYKDLESFPQEVEVQNINLSQFKQTLKHITLLPEFVFVPSKNEINLKALGTYYHNKVEDITYKVKWKISDKDVLIPLKNGEFSAGSVGITEVIAELDNLESLPSKIIVLGKGDFSSAHIGYKISEEIKISSKDLVSDIEEDAKKLNKNLLEKRKLNRIKIIPDYLEIPLGEDGQLVALGIYSDSSQEDLSLLAEWTSSDNKVVTVSKGKIATHSTGESKVYAQFQEISSLSSAVIVEGPKLVSIVLSPQDSRISMKDKLNLKAEGYFTDSSHKDITSSVIWKISNPGVVKIEKGVARPLRIGKTQVGAEYQEIKSLPVNIKVIITMDWLMSTIIKVTSFLIFGIIIALLVLYFLTKNKRNKLKLLLDKNPREFIVSLYENTKKILALFNLSYKEFIPPLSYAELVQQKYPIENNLFLRFTTIFEEAKYSQHIIQTGAAVTVLDDYNNFLKILFSRHNYLCLVFKYCLSLLLRVPLFISRSRSFPKISCK